jgi:hypothetical protein
LRGGGGGGGGKPLQIPHLYLMLLQMQPVDIVHAKLDTILFFKTASLKTLF